MDRVVRFGKTAVADAMVELFDRHYTRPLLGWRALLRSATLPTMMHSILARARLFRLKTWDIPCPQACCGYGGVPIRVSSIQVESGNCTGRFGLDKEQDEPESWLDQ